MTDLKSVATRYKQADYTKEATKVALLNGMSKCEIVKILGFEKYTIDYAIPQDLWDQYKVQNCVSMYPCHNAGALDSNGNQYRLNFRVFDIYRLFVRYVNNLVTEVFKPSKLECINSNLVAINTIIQLTEEISESSNIAYQAKCKRAIMSLKSNCNRLFNALNYESIDNIVTIKGKMLEGTL
jgi:hypothetical protein